VPHFSLKFEVDHFAGRAGGAKEAEGSCQEGKGAEDELGPEQDEKECQEVELMGTIWGGTLIVVTDAVLFSMEGFQIRLSWSWC
jgi:hypothetical protein